MSERTMVERVARALARHQVMVNARIDAARNDKWPDADIEAAIGYAWRDYTAPARDAIAAMRDPDDVTLDAVGYGRDSLWREDYLREHRRMIDAALAKATGEEG